MFLLKENRVIKIVSLVFLIPFGFILADIFLKFFLNLGRYGGTFIRALYEFFV